MQHSRLANLALIPILTFFSFILITLYVAGDQVYYRDFYAKIASASYAESFIIAKGTIGASEPLSIFILWIGSTLGIDKDLFITFLNSILIYSLYKLSVKYRFGFVIFVFFALNFYIVVLMTGAERLKIGYIFLFLSILFEGRFRIFLIAMSVLAHFQMFLFLPSMLIYHFYEDLRALFSRLVIRKAILKILVLVTISLLVVFPVIWGSILSKLNAYLDFNRSILELVNVLVFIVMGVFSSKDHKRLIVCSIPIIIWVFLLILKRITRIFARPGARRPRKGRHCQGQWCTGSMV